MPLQSNWCISTSPMATSPPPHPGHGAPEALMKSGFRRACRLAKRCCVCRRRSRMGSARRTASRPARWAARRRRPRRCRSASGISLLGHCPSTRRRVDHDGSSWSPTTAARSRAAPSPAFIASRSRNAAHPHPPAQPGPERRTRAGVRLAEIRAPLHGRDRDPDRPSAGERRLQPRVQ